MADDLREGFEELANPADLEKSSRKFPYAVLVDADGQSTGAKVFLNQESARELNDQVYDPEQHKGHLGCPCCLAPLKVIEGGYIQKGDDKNPASAYLKSESLNDHVERGCVLGEPSSADAKKILSLLDYLSQEGDKIIYWNFPYKSYGPTYYLGDHIGYSLRAPHATAVTSRQEKTRGFKNLKEFMAIFRYIDPNDPVIDRIDVVAGHCRFPLREILAGNDRDGLSKLTEIREELGLAYPSILSVEFGSMEEPIKVGRETIFASKTLNGFYQNQHRVSVVTNNPDVAAILENGGAFVLHGFVSTVDTDDDLLDNVFDPDDEVRNELLVRIDNPDDILPVSNPLNARMLRKPSYMQEEPEAYHEAVEAHERWAEEKPDLAAE